MSTVSPLGYYMDFVEGLPKSDGYNVILVVVDRFTKYAHFIPLVHPFTAQTVAKAFLANVVKLHGFPRTIVSDRDKIFTSTFWKELFKLAVVELHTSTSYHPQTDGQTERVNQCLEMYLRCAVHDCPTKWMKWLALAEFWYNTCYHTSLGCSPFKALYGMDPPSVVIPVLQFSDHTDVVELMKERQLHTEFLKNHLSRAQNRIKMQADKNRVDRPFQVGEQVLLKLQPYAQSSLVNRPCPKLAYKFFGPYSVLERVGNAAYRLDLPTDSKIHHVFHVSQLKPFTADYSPVFSDLPTIVELDTDSVMPEQILERRLVKKGNSAATQVLVKWTGLPQEMATWEDYHVLKKRFPSTPV